MIRENQVQKIIRVMDLVRDGKSALTLSEAKKYIDFLLNEREDLADELVREKKKTLGLLRAD